MKQKQRLWNRYINTNDTNILNHVRRQTRNIVRQREKNIASNVKDNPKKFWSYHQSRTKTKAAVASLYVDDNKKQVTSCNKSPRALWFLVLKIILYEGSGNGKHVSFQHDWHYFDMVKFALTILDHDVEKLPFLRIRWCGVFSKQ